MAKTRRHHKHKISCYSPQGIPTCGKMTPKEREAYEDLIDSADAARAIRDIAEGRDRVIGGEELNRRLAAMGLKPF